MGVTQQFHVAVPTAFYDDETLNITATLEHMLALKEQGAGSVMICGSTGEQHSLTLAEKLTLVEAIQAEAAFSDDFEIIFGVASTRQLEAEKLAVAIESVANIDGILLGFPPYIMPSQKEALSYLQAICEKTQKPVIIYNNPRRTGFDLSIASFVEIAKLTNVIGIKEAGDSARIPDLHAQTAKPIEVYIGGEFDLAQKVALGVTRLSSIVGNLHPQVTLNWFTELVEAKNPATITTPEQISEELTKMFAASPLPYLKQAITKKEEVAMGVCRKPLGNS